MQDYQKTAVKEFPSNPIHVSSESRYWKKFKFPILSKQFAAVTHVDFSPVKPHHFAVTASTRVVIYNPLTNAVMKTISRFKDVAYGASFRADGKLMAAGGEEKIVQVFDLGTRAILRQFRGHEGAVHITRFSSDNVTLVSGSDDKSVRCWDLATAQLLTTLTGHSDHVRSLVASPSSPAIFVSGSYDHTVRVWDIRAAPAQACVMEVNHQSPVEALLMFPGGGLVVTAGGDNFQVWDVLGGGRLLHAARTSQKAITSLCLDGTGERLLTGSLDQHVRVHDVISYKPLHSMKYPAPILCIGLSPTSSHLAVGMSNGMLSIRQRLVRPAAPAPGSAANPLLSAEAQMSERSILHGGSYRYFLRGKNMLPSASDHTVEKGRKARLKDYDIFLKKFQYKNALDAALNAGRPVIGISVLEELSARDGLKIAVSGRDEAGLEPLLTFINKHITNPRYSSMLVDVANLVFDIYASILGQSVTIDTLFVQLRAKLAAELNFQRDLLGLLGTMELVIAAGAAPHPSS